MDSVKKIPFGKRVLVKCSGVSPIWNRRFFGKWDPSGNSDGTFGIRRQNVASLKKVAPPR